MRLRDIAYETYSPRKIFTLGFPPSRVIILTEGRDSPGVG